MWLGTTKPQPDSLFVEGWGGPAAHHVLLVLRLLLLWDLSRWKVSLQEFAAFLVAESPCVETGAHIRAPILDTFVRALAMEGILQIWKLGRG